MSIVRCGLKKEATVNWQRTRVSRSVLYRDSGDTYYVNVRYVVLCNEMPSDARFDEQHSVLNSHYNASNYELTMIPKSGHYAYASAIGNPGIVFQRKEIVHKPAAYQIDSVSDILKNERPEPGCMNIYVADISSGGKLGEAQLDSNALMVDVGTIGGPRQKGTRAPYDLGITVVHEMAHAIGDLPHPFNSSETCSRVFSDMPEQKNPNYFGMLVKKGTGNEWDGTMCNRYYDCHPEERYPGMSGMNIERPYSCSSSCSGLYEPFFNIMDYAQDPYSIMFSKEQCQHIRMTLAGNSNLISSRNSNMFIGQFDSSSDFTTSVSSSSSSSSFPLWAIILSVVGGIAVLVVVVFLVRRHLRNRG